MNKSITIIDYRYSDRRCYQAALSLNEGLLSFLLPCSGVCPPCAPEDRVSRVTSHLGHESRVTRKKKKMRRCGKGEKYILYFSEVVGKCGREDEKK